MSKIEEQLNEERSLYRFLDTYMAYTPLTGEQAIAGKLINSNGEVQEVLIHYGDLTKAVMGFDIAEETDRRTGWAERHPDEKRQKQPTEFYDPETISTDENNESVVEDAVEGNQESDDQNSGDDFDSGKATEVPSIQPSQTGSVSNEYVQKLEKQKFDAEAHAENMADKVEHAHDNVTTPEFRKLGTIVDMDDIDDIAEISRINSMTPEERKIANRQALEKMQKEGHEETFSAVAAMQAQLQDESEQAKVTDSEDDDGSGDEEFY